MEQGAGQAEWETQGTRVGELGQSPKLCAAQFVKKPKRGICLCFARLQSRKTETLSGGNHYHLPCPDMAILNSQLAQLCRKEHKQKRGGRPFNKQAIVTFKKEGRKWICSARAHPSLSTTSPPSRQATCLRLCPDPAPPRALQSGMGKHSGSTSPDTVTGREAEQH